MIIVMRILLILTLFKCNLSILLQNYIQNASFVEQYEFILHRCGWKQRQQQQQQVTNIQESNVIYEYENFPENEACIAAEYISECKRKHEDLQKISATQSKLIMASSQSSPVTIHSADGFSYYEVFTDFILREKPFIYNSTNLLTLQIHSDLNDNNDIIFPLTHDISLSKILDKFNSHDVLIPSIAESNYLVRFSIPSSASVSMHSINYASQWPALVQFTSNQPQNLHQCPNDLSMILWATSSPLILRIFTSKQASSFTKHDLDFTSNVPQHHIIYEQNGFESDHRSHNNQYTEVILQHGQVFYLPSNHFISIKTVSEAQTVYVLRHCIVDASNIRQFISSLSIEAKITPSSRQLLDTLSQLLGNPIQDDDSPFYMNMYPQDITLKEYYSKRVPVPVPPVSNMATSKRVGFNFKDWQETNKWRLLMKSLTMPMPTVPSPIKTGRDFITLQWSSRYAPPTMDKSLFGFKIIHCKLSTFIENATTAEECSTQIFSRGDGKLSEHRSTTLATTLFSAKFRELQPEISYKFRMTMFYGKGTGSTALTAWSEVVNTLPYGTPELITSDIYSFVKEDGSVFIRFEDPEDNGGKPLLGYHIYARYEGQYMYHDWLKICTYQIKDNKPTQDINRKDGVTILKIKNIIPNSSASFRINSFNEFGDSLLSEERTDILIYNRNNSYEMLDYAPGMLIQDSPETISIQSCHSRREIELNVWSCNFSPKLYSLRSNKIYVNQSDLSMFSTTQISPNISTSCSYLSPDIAGSISVIKRTFDYPLLNKILHLQASGAVAVVIVDTKGVCTGYNQHCFPGSDKSHQEGFASADIHKTWSFVRIPVVFALKDIASSLFSYVANTIK